MPGVEEDDIVDEPVEGLPFDGSIGINESGEGLPIFDGSTGVIESGEEGLSGGRWRSSRATAGQHSNPYRLPKSALAQLSGHEDD